MRLQSSLKTRCKILLRGFWKSCSAQHDHQMMKMDDDIYFLSKIHSNPSSHSVPCKKWCVCKLSPKHMSVVNDTPFKTSTILHESHHHHHHHFQIVWTSKMCLFVHHFLNHRNIHSLCIICSLLYTITLLGKLTWMIIITLF